VKIYNNIDDYDYKGKTAVTVGTFDGVHLGHKKIINTLIESAAENNFPAILLTFNPHPQLVLKHENYNIKLLNTLEEKIKLFKITGIKNLIIVPFNLEFAKTSGDKFIEEIIVGKLHASNIIIGYDHHFGSDRSGEINSLSQKGKVLDFKTIRVSEVIINNTTVSSTKIRKAIMEGDISSANLMLGYSFSVEGSVVEGEKIGKTIGFPTANIKIEDFYKIIPKDGVYLVKVIYNGIEFSGMCNIGFRPTFNSSKKTIEINIFGFNKDIYSEKIQVEFISRLRDELKFNNIEELKNQINNDKQLSLDLIEKMKI